MPTLKLVNGDVVRARIVKPVKACPTDKMAVWHDDNGRSTTGVKKLSRGKYIEVV